MHIYKFYEISFYYHSLYTRISILMRGCDLSQLWPFDTMYFSRYVLSTLWPFDEMTFHLLAFRCIVLRPTVFRHFDSNTLRGPRDVSLIFLAFKHIYSKCLFGRKERFSYLHGAKTRGGKWTTFEFFILSITIKNFETYRQNLNISKFCQTLVLM